ELEDQIKELPDFSFLSLEGTAFTKGNLKEGTNTVFIYFNSECDFCVSETTKIQERLAEFENTELIFVSFEAREKIVDFAKHHQLFEVENIMFLEDEKLEFSTLFGAQSIPAIFIYDGNKLLLKKFKGATKIDAILKSLNINTLVD
ncbi:peroxiredoxin family protein, partial [Flavicella sediminum]|uniref:peroxiredoxin family protein n=1 Tax=Flavicella sediminum TaxID=2585141 RepID=UPI001123AA37